MIIASVSLEGQTFLFFALGDWGKFSAKIPEKGLAPAA